MTAKIQRIIIVSSLFANNSRKILNPLKEEYIQGEERLNSSSSLSSATSGFSCSLEPIVLLSTNQKN